MPPRRGTSAARASGGPASPAIASAASTALRGAAKGMILIVASIWPRRTRQCGGRVAMVIASSIPFSRSIRPASSSSTPSLSAWRLARPVKAAWRRTPGPAAARRDRLRRRVLGHVGGVELGRHDRLDPGLGEGGEVGSGEHPALLHPNAGDRLAMRQDRAFGLAKGEGAEIHQANPRRSVSVTSARIATAISAGDLAPMSRPMGPWMRAISASPKPSSASRSLRLACVRVEPRQPT